MRCDECRWFACHHDEEGGFCHRYPPIEQGEGNRVPITVCLDGFCGEYTPAGAPETKGGIIGICGLGGYDDRLRRNGIDTTDKLCQLAWTDLLMLREIGYTGAFRIITALADHGLTLRH